MYAFPATRTVNGEATTEAEALGLVQIHPDAEATVEVVAEAEAIVEAEVDHAQVEAELRAEIERLTNQATLLNATIERQGQTIESQRDRLTVAVQNHHKDIARIGEKLIEEAEDRGWCDDFDDIVDDLNRYLNQELPTRRRDYVVTVEITVSSVRSEDRARDEIQDMLRHQNYDIVEVNEAD